MDVGEDQRAQVRDGKVDRQRIGAAAPAGLVALEDAAVDEDARLRSTRAVQGEFVAGAGDGAVVDVLGRCRRFAEGRPR